MALNNIRARISKQQETPPQNTDEKKEVHKGGNISGKVIFEAAEEVEGGSYGA